ncbi:proline-rich transmembrane protein 1-like [Actinia tenebrosa]|uniref:Proline-rich transmembrane protein 1-like n=1 Tax=Actinia tenebrosa TaxID=6105 RepID=A0A6P8IUL7_ACTTE|nr:proline-rich transmembrane protein 1-like [Actinia tenebrosa]
MVVARPVGVPPPDYQALAWFACLCCCWPLGLVAIIRSNEVRTASARGDYLTAEAASRSARTMSFLAIGLGIAFMVLYIIILTVYLIPLLTMENTYNDYN